MKMGVPDSVDDSQKNDLFTSPNSIPIIHNSGDENENSDDPENNNRGGYAGYVQLGQQPGGFDDADDHSDDSEEEDGDQNVIIDPVPPSVDDEINCEVWNAPRPTELKNIELDSTKTQEILSAMASISLPRSAIPDWAQVVPDEKLKDYLLVKLREKKGESSSKPPH